MSRTKRSRAGAARQSLLEQARVAAAARQRPKFHGNKPTEDELELIGAWLRGEINDHQVAHAIGVKPRYVPNWVALRLRYATRLGMEVPVR